MDMIHENSIHHSTVTENKMGKGHKVMVEENNNNSIQSKQNLLLISLTRFFDNPNNMQTYLDIIKGSSVLSLRLLDWLVTNYSKMNNVVYDIQDENGGTRPFNMFLNYKTQLKAYSKKQFDPFQRRERISFNIQSADGLTKHISTVGQLNFFRWAIQNNVIDYAQNHIQNIEKSMNKGIANRRKNQKVNIKEYKGKERSVKPKARVVTTQKVNTVVQF